MFANLIALIIFSALVFGLTFKFGPKLPGFILHSLAYLLTPRGNRNKSQKEKHVERKRITLNTLSASMATPVIDNPLTEKKVVWPAPIDYSKYETPSKDRPLISGRKLSRAFA